MQKAQDVMEGCNVAFNFGVVKHQQVLLSNYSDLRALLVLMVVGWVKKFPAVELCDDACPLREQLQASQAQVQQCLVFGVSPRRLFEGGGHLVAVSGKMLS